MLTRTLTFAAVAALALPAFAQTSAPPQDRLNPGQNAVDSVQQEINAAANRTQDRLDGIEGRIDATQDRVQNRIDRAQNRVNAAGDPLTPRQDRVGGAQDRRVQDPLNPQFGNVQPGNVQPEPGMRIPQIGGRTAPGAAAAVPTDALIRWVSQDNQAEIALARFAQQKTENPAVREFAQKMIDAHTQFGQKLDAAARSAGPGATNRRASGFRGGADPNPNADPLVDPAPRAPGEVLNEGVDAGDAVEEELEAFADPTDPPAVTPGQPLTTRPLNRQDRRATRGPAGNDPATAGQLTTGQPMNQPRGGRMGLSSDAGAANLLAFRGRLKEKCGETLKENFDKLSPAEFDKAYSSQQIGAHLSMIDTLALAAEQADGQAAEVFRTGRTETEQHLTMAIGLLNSVTPRNPAAGY